MLIPLLNSARGAKIVCIKEAEPDKILPLPYRLGPATMEQEVERMNRTKHRRHVNFVRASMPQRTNRVPDRMRQRREYLLRKGTAQARLVTVKVIVGMVVVILFAGCAIANLIIGSVPQGDRGYVFAMLAALAFSGCYFLMAHSERLLHVMEREVKSIPYVPPVTPDTLPAAEVLVRGAEPPTVTSETLLRAGLANVDTAPEQLLRVGSGAVGEQNR